MTLPAPIDIENGGSIARLADRLQSLTEEADKLAEHGHLDLLAWGLDDLRAFKRAVRDLEVHVEGLVAEMMDSKFVDLGGTTVERHRNVDRKFDSDGLLSELIRQSNIDPDTGEVFDDRTARDRLIERLRACVPFTRSLGWRTKPLRAYGVDPDEYSEKTARTSVSVHRTHDEDKDGNDG